MFYSARLGSGSRSPTLNLKRRFTRTRCCLLSGRGFVTLLDQASGGCRGGRRTEIVAVVRSHTTGALNRYAEKTRDKLPFCQISKPLRAVGVANAPR